VSSPNSGKAYCHNCGAELPPGATFCPKCGTPVYVAPPAGAPPPAAPPPSSQPPPYYDRRAYREWRRQQRGEKGEKGEKYEKGEKGGPGGGLIGPLIGGAILVWLGISFYLQDIGYLSGNWWAVFVIGLGFIIMFQGVLFYTRLHRAVIGPFIGGGILVLVGLAFFYNGLGNLWPLILVVIGLAVVASAFTARRRSPSPTTT
jgi:hypothetical protein